VHCTPVHPNTESGIAFESPLRRIAFKKKTFTAFEEEPILNYPANADRDDSRIDASVRGRSPAEGSDSFVSAPRRRMLFGGLGVALGVTCGVLPTLLRTPRAFGQSAGRPAAAAPSAGAAPPRGTRIVLLGTRAGPGVDLTRGQSSSAVVVDGHTYLVDCGYGAVRALTAAGIALRSVSSLFLTHLHNDHTLDIPALLSLQWTGNKMEPTQVFGPPGTSALVAAAVDFFAGDVEIRTVDEGRTLRPADLFKGSDVAATAAPAAVFEDERIRVSSVENTHFSTRATARMPHRSLAYRVEAPGRSIVFSGDTAYSENLVGLARGADVFVCEVIAQSVYDQMMARAKADAEAGHAESVSRHVAETHSTPAAVGRMATEAGVKTVVLNHQLAPAAPAGGLNGYVSTFIEGVRSEFDGEVIVGQDLMVL
jgi:ribonuclease BN (tRNA processing enzyme)